LTVEQVACIKKFKNYLRNGAGVFILIEYDTDKGNQWVPFPFSFARVRSLFGDAGFSKIEKIGERQSLYRRDSIYAALISPL
jgi:hypothetical protein